MVQLFSLKDDKVQSFSGIMMARTKGEAVRLLSDQLESRQDHVSRHPEDYALYYIGDYDEITGKITQKEISHVIGASALVMPKEEKNG